MKIGLFFGSFNPIHTGHLIIANYMADYTDLDEVWFVVSPQNPFKSEQNLLDEKPISIDVEGSDEGEQLTHILGAIDVLERVKLENKDKSTALREFFQRVRNSIS